MSYSDYRNFLKVIAKVKTACENSGHSVGNHFVDTTDMVEIGSGARRRVEKGSIRVRVRVRVRRMVVGKKLSRWWMIGGRRGRGGFSSFEVFYDDKTYFDNSAERQKTYLGKIC